MEAVIEVVNRNNKVLFRQKVKGDTICLGRSYQSDVIIDEPHVAPEHALLQEDEQGHWILTDVSSCNGITFKQQKIDQPVQIQSGDIFSLGKVHIRIVELSHPVKKTVPISPLESLHEQLGKLTTFIILAIVLVAWTGFDYYLGLIDEFKFELFWRRIFSNVLPVVLLWSVFWAVFGRLLKHDDRMLLHVNIAMLYLLVLDFIEKTNLVIAFNSGSFLLTESYYFIFYTLSLFLVIYIALNITTYWKRSNRILITSLVILVIQSTTILSWFREDGFSSRPEYVATVLSPAWKFVEAKNQDDFIQESQQIFELARQERQEKLQYQFSHKEEN